MGLLAIWTVSLLILWTLGAFVATILLPRHKAKIVASAVLLPVAAVVILFTVTGNYSRSGLIPPSQGLTQAQVGRCLAEVFSEDNLGRLIRREGLSSRLTQSEVKPRIAVSDPIDDRDSHSWTVGSGNTWKWKADAYSRLAQALSGDIEARLEALRKVH